MDRKDFAFIIVFAGLFSLVLVGRVPFPWSPVISFVLMIAGLVFFNIVTMHEGHLKIKCVGLAFVGIGFLYFMLGISFSSFWLMLSGGILWLSGFAIHVIIYRFGWFTH